MNQIRHASSDYGSSLTGPMIKDILICLHFD
jgi:hypothetical protein